MNERIKQLALQAGITVVPKPFDDASRSWNNTMEKFAELIVRECVAICQDINGEDNIDAKSGRQDCAVEILEHFGVEE